MMQNRLWTIRSTRRSMWCARLKRCWRSADERERFARGSDGAAFRRDGRAACFQRGLSKPRQRIDLPNEYEGLEGRKEFGFQPRRRGGHGAAEDRKSTRL